MMTYAVRLMRLKLLTIATGAMMMATMLSFSDAANAQAAANPGDARKAADVQERPTIAVYYFPNYHPGDARNEKVKGQGWSEWELVKAARPRFPGHQQPKVPLWGYTDESNPRDMAQKIDAAANYGIDAFIFDWYWYDDGPFLEQGLDQGFLNAANNARLKFALMWANHDWTDIHPRKLGGSPPVLYRGRIQPATWETMTDVIIEKYFKHPSYWKINGCPYFSIYEVKTFADSFGSASAARQAVDRFRAKVKAAGFPDLHLNLVMWGHPILPGETPIQDPAQVVKTLGANSVTSYVWIHHAGVNGFPAGAYEDNKKTYFDYAQKAMTLYGVSYYPNVSMGWDASPRTDPNAPFENIGYPYMGVLTGNTPEAFEQALQEARTLLQTRPADERILTINSWNEWTEGSYLEPDTVHQLGYLEAVRAVFGLKTKQPDGAK